MCCEHTPAPHGNVNSIHVSVVMETFSFPPLSPLDLLLKQAWDCQHTNRWLIWEMTAKFIGFCLVFLQLPPPIGEAQGGRRNALSCGTRPISQTDRFPARNLSDANNNHGAIFVCIIRLFSAQGMEGKTQGHTEQKCETKDRYTLLPL